MYDLVAGKKPTSHWESKALFMNVSEGKTKMLVIPIMPSAILYPDNCFQYYFHIKMVNGSNNDMSNKYEKIRSAIYFQAYHSFWFLGNKFKLYLHTFY